MSTPIKYTPGQLHAIRLDDNTIALVMPEDYAATVRDVLHYCDGSSDRTRRKYTQMVWYALNNVQDMPALVNADMSSRSGQGPFGIEFTHNPAVLK